MQTSRSNKEPVILLEWGLDRSIRGSKWRLVPRRLTWLLAVSSTSSTDKFSKGSLLEGTVAGASHSSLFSYDGAVTPKEANLGCLTMLHQVQKTLWRKEALGAQFTYIWRWKPTDVYGREVQRNRSMAYWNLMRTIVSTARSNQPRGMNIKIFVLFSSDATDWNTTQVTRRHYSSVMSTADRLDTAGG